jgi:predicted ABC-class ATPase
MTTAQELRHQLQSLDGRGYKAYKAIRGHYTFDQFTLLIDYVQGDPFAAPSRLRVRVPQTIARYPASTYQNESRRIGLENYLATTFAAVLDTAVSRRGSGKSGLLTIDAPGQTMLARSCLQVNSEFVEAQIAVGLPAQGRRVLGRAAAQMLCDDLPQIVTQSLLYASNDARLIEQYTATAEDADFLRRQLQARGLVAFVADGAILPRQSGVDERPLRDKNGVPWQGPAAYQTSFTLPNAGKVVGTGIPAGVTLIVGGGFHGKSTLLNALSHGVYNHKPGDGRERVVTAENAVKIRAEDGRSVSQVDISPFINNLPFGQQTQQFSSENASGSTSQAANIMEALEVGTDLLLIDEDTAATNFMIRDRRMQQLVSKAREPITPFIDRVRQLFSEHGVSTILVIGGSGDYFDVADQVIGLEIYQPSDLTAAAKAIADSSPTGRASEAEAAFGAIRPRVPLPRSLDTRKGRRETNVKTRGLHTIQFGTETIDLAAVAQLVDASQTRAIAAALAWAKERLMDGKRPFSTILTLIQQEIEANGLDTLSPYPGNDFAAFRPHELAAALNRLRSLQTR